MGVLAPALHATDRGERARVQDSGRDGGDGAGQARYINGRTTVRRRAVSEFPVGVVAPALHAAARGEVLGLGPKPAAVGGISLDPTSSSGDGFDARLLALLLAVVAAATAAAGALGSVARRREA